MARPAFKFDDRDRQLVAALARNGVKSCEISRELNIDLKTLRKHFGDVIESVRAKRKMAKLSELWRKAEGGSARALIAVHATS
jgi:hypothetical protein